MNTRDLISAVAEGSREALRIGLDRDENWTPLLTYIHVTRLVVGLGLGMLIGLVGTSLVFLLIRAIR